MGRAMKTGLGATDSKFIDGDLECVGCGYNLRTLASDANCPECAAPVADSVDAFPPAFLFRRWSSIRWIRLGLLLWVLSILAWAGGLIYCTMRVAWATELWVAARWSYNSGMLWNVSWVIEIGAIFCLCRGITIEARRTRQLAAIIAVSFYFPGCLFHAFSLFIALTQGMATSGSIVLVMAPFTLLGSPVALATMCLLLLMTTSSRARAIRTALCFLLLSMCIPLIGAAFELIWALITVDPDFDIYRWRWPEFGRIPQALNYVVTVISLFIVDRGLRTARKAHVNFPLAPNCSKPTMSSTAFN